MSEKSENEHVPAGVDPFTPNIARMYDYYLGGKDNFAVDRAAAEEFRKIVPHIKDMARDNREFLARAVTVMAEEGIDQFLTIGAGLPTQHHTHHVAHRVNPKAVVVYTDTDPVVLAHGRALLADNPYTTVVQADLREPEALLDHPQIRGRLDYDRPLGVTLLSMLQFIPDEKLIARILAAVRAVLVPGSYLLISHAFKGQESPEKLAAARAVYAKTSAGSLNPRSFEEILSFFDGFELIEPGLVPVEAWRPEWDDIVPDFTRGGMLGGVGRVPYPAQETADAAR